MIRWLLLLLLITAPTLAFAEEDMEKDLRDFQQSVEGVLKNLTDSTQGVNPASQLDVARRKVFALAGDKKFLKAVNDLWASPNRNTLLIVQGIFFVVLFLLKSWRQSKATNWFKKILIGLFFSVIMWAGLFYVIPAIVLGEPFRILVSTLWHVLVSS